MDCNKRKRLVSWVLSVSMLTGMLPMGVLAADTEAVSGTPDVQAAEEGLVLHYDFESLKTGTIVNDVSGNGKSGEVMPRGSGVQTQEVNIYGQKQTAIVLQGGQPGTGHNYVEMPVGVLNGLESATISCWVNIQQSSGYARIWDIGSNTTSYMYLLDSGWNAGHTGYSAAITNSGWGNEEGPEKGTALQTNQWILTTVTFDGTTNTMTMYEDGVQVGDAVETSVGLNILNGSTQNYIGYGQFGNDLLNGMVADFRIYDYAMSADEVAGMFSIPDDERVNRDYEALTLGDTSAVTSDLTLPTKGEAGSTISWATTNESAVAADGKITRPQPGEADASATLTATISSGEVSRTKEFAVTVKALPTDQERVDADAAAIDLGSLSAVIENLTLPTKGALESTITWASSDPDHLSTEGVVTRPVGKPVTVTLTATVAYGSVSKELTFDVTIMPLYEKLDIVKAEAVEVTTQAGIVPSLPAVVKATYEDGTTGMVKVTWPVGEDADTYKEVGTTTVTGQLVDSPVTVTATVNIVEKMETPSAVADLFDLEDVSLDGKQSIYSQNMARALEYLKVMDADRMLYNFRATFGQDTKGAQALTGWDEPSGLLRGHSTGHFLSALAQAYASSGDEVYKEKLDYMITEMRKIQELSKGDPSEFKTACTPTDAAQSKWSKDPSTWGEGYIGAYSPDQFALLEQYTPYATIWAPYYTMHKLLAGFLDSYTYAGNETGLEIAKDLGLWVYDRLSACTEEQREKMWAMYIAGEYGGMNEAMTRLYEITGDERYLETAKMFDNAVFFDGLAVGEDTIQDRHANQHIPQIVGAIEMYTATGDSYYYNIAKHFWELTTARYAYSIGGVGTGERFQDPYAQGANILGNEGRGENCETCAAYNMLKLTRKLYAYDPDNAAYMDYYERTLLNQIAASQSHDTNEWMHNGVTYMLPIDPGQQRGFDSDYGGFTCCNGTGMENHVLYQIAAYAKTDDTLYVNLYMPTTVEWEEKGISVTQETTFPSEDSALTITGSGNFTMKLRVPYWATEGFTVTVNDEVICTEATPSSYVAINRTWSDGDVVRIHMPYTLYLDKTPDTVDGDVVASLMYGPMVMVAKDNRSTYVPMNWYTVSATDSNLDEVVTIAEPAGTGETPHLVLDGLDFYPMYDAYNYRYHAYVKLMESQSVLNTQWLEEAVAEARTLTEGQFDQTADWQAMQTALTAAEELLASVETEEVTQLALFDAETALENAMNKRNDIVHVTGVELDQTNLSLTTGNTATLVATVLPENAEDNRVTWSSSDTTVATVEDGIVKAFTAGTAVITVTTNDGSFTDACTVSVSAPSAGDDSSVTRYTITVKQTDGGKISPATCRVDRGNDKTFTITADNGYAIADVLVDGKSVGAVSTYTFEDVKSSHTITATFEKTGESGNVGGFTDVKEDDWFAESVQYVVENKLMGGVSETAFAPNSATTRAMFVTILARMEGVDTTTGSTWYEAGQKWAMEEDISDGSNMEGIMTREQLATMLYRYAGSPAVSSELTGFADAASVSDWASDAMKWAVEEGILNGSDGKLNPQGNATRAQVAAMLMRYLEQ